MADPPSHPAADAPPDPRKGNPSPRVLDSVALFDGATEVVIRHGGRDYRLRRTRLGKLILTA